MSLNPGPEAGGKPGAWTYGCAIAPPDWKHFSVVRPKHVPHLTLLPE